MSAVFLNVIAQTTIIDFFGFGINVPTYLYESGYIAVDESGAVFVYEEEPVMKPNGSFWATPYTDPNAQDYTQQVYTLKNHTNIDGISDWYEKEWVNLCFRINEFPVLRTA